MLFLDRCLGNYDVPEALRNAGVNIELHADRFEADSPDSDWLAKVGQHGWIVLTKDRQIKSNYLQLVAFVRNQVKAFALTSADMNGKDMGIAFVAALGQMLKLIAKFPAPF